jgi:hypothetical protein
VFFSDVLCHFSSEFRGQAKPRTQSLVLTDVIVMSRRLIDENLSPR